MSHMVFDIFKIANLIHVKLIKLKSDYQSLLESKDLLKSIYN